MPAVWSMSSSVHMPAVHCVGAAEKVPAVVRREQQLKPQEFEQALAHTRDTLPRIWFSVYQGCLQAGFDARQAMSLTQTYVLSQCPYGVKPDGSSITTPDDKPE